MHYSTLEVQPYGCPCLTHKQAFIGAEMVFQMCMEFFSKLKLLIYVLSSQENKLRQTELSQYSSLKIQ